MSKPLRVILEGSFPVPGKVTKHEPTKDHLKNFALLRKNRTVAPSDKTSKPAEKPEIFGRKEIKSSEPKQEPKPVPTPSSKFRYTEPHKTGPVTSAPHEWEQPEHQKNHADITHHTHNKFLASAPKAEKGKEYRPSGKYNLHQYIGKEDNYKDAVRKYSHPSPNLQCKHCQSRSVQKVHPVEKAKEVGYTHFCKNCSNRWNQVDHEDEEGNKKKVFQGIQHTDSKGKTTYQSHADDVAKIKGPRPADKVKTPFNNKRINRWL